MSLISPTLSAQDNNKSSVTNQIWLDFNPKYKFTERWALGGTVGAKTIFPHSWTKVYISPQMEYNMPKFMLKKLMYKETLYLGIDLYSIFYTSADNLIEVSPFQGYGLTWPNRKRLDIKHMLKLKERFQWDTHDWDYSFGLQLSYEASITFKFHGDVWKYGNGFYLTASIKFFWNLVDAALFNDVARITPGIGYQINPKWKTAFLLGYNYTRDGDGESFHTNNIIYRFRIYYTIN